MLKVAPSILAADFSKLGDEIKSVDSADLIHIDIMDGHFVPNISFGYGVVGDIRSYTQKPFDVHLMISHPLEYIKQFADAGADYITVHLECEDDILKCIKAIKEENKKPGIAVSPDTPAEAVLPYLEYTDIITVMSVYPGFGGQSFIESTYEKIEKINEYIKAYDIILSVDGGVDLKNARKLEKCGATAIVAGSSVFKSQDRIKTIIELRGYDYCKSDCQFYLTCFANYEECLKKNCENVLSTLTSDEQHILRLKYGWFNNKKYSLEEISTELGIPKSNVEKLLKKALEKLIQPSRAEILEDYLPDIMSVKELTFYVSLLKDVFDPNFYYYKIFGVDYAVIKEDRVFNNSQEMRDELNSDIADFKKLAPYREMFEKEGIKTINQLTHIPKKKLLNHFFKGNIQDLFAFEDALDKMGYRIKIRYNRNGKLEKSLIDNSRKNIELLTALVDRKYAKINMNKILKKQASNIKIEELDISICTYNILKRYGYNTVADIISAKKDDLRKYDGLVLTGFYEILYKIENFGFEFEEDKSSEV